MSKTILIADDSSTMRIMLEEILSKEGYRVITAEDGLQAVIMAFEKNPDLIISDIEMPIMDGYHVCRLLKNEPKLAKTPIIILTSKESSGAVFWGYQTGADRYIFKDFKPEELHGHIKTLLEAFPKTQKSKKSFKPELMDQSKIMEKLNTFLDNQLFEMTLINEISQATVNLTSLTETISSLLEILDKAIENHVLGFAVLSQEKEIFVGIKLSKPMEEKRLELFEFQALENLAILMNQDISSYSIEVEVKNEELIEENGEESSETEELDPNFVYSMPLRSKESSIGVLVLYHPEMESIPAEQKRLLEKLGNYISTAVNTTLMYNKIKDLSIIDALSQLFNRRYTMEAYKMALNKANRYQQHLSLVMMDIDNFKNINDTYGHLTGDLIIKTISDLIKNSIRNFDIPGRYGGEEFILILPETKKQDAVIVAERIRNAVESYAFNTIGGDEITVTISAGLSDINEMESRSNELEMIKIADANLYKAKKQGRNRVVFNDE